MHQEMMSQDHQNDAKQPGEFCVFGRRKEEIPGGVRATKSEVNFWWKFSMTTLARWIPRKASPTVCHTVSTLLSHQFPFFLYTIITLSLQIISHFFHTFFHTSFTHVFTPFFHTSFTLLSHFCHTFVTMSFTTSSYSSERSARPHECRTACARSAKQ